MRGGVGGGIKIQDIERVGHKKIMHRMVGLSVSLSNNTKMFSKSRLVIHCSK